MPHLPDQDAPARVAARLLGDAGWLAPGERVEHAAPAGPGNMNLTLRVRVRNAGGAARSVVLKHARAFVEKHPSIAAPAERVLAEHGFYAEAAALPDSAERDRVLGLLPAVRGFDPARRLLLLEDLGEAADLTGLYAGGGFGPGELAALGGWLGALHAATRGAAGAGLRDNGAMRELNAEHLFEVPLDGVARFGIHLDGRAPGLTAAADALRGDPGVRRAFRRARHAYLAPAGPDAVLLHGDFHPGSWLRVSGGLRGLRGDPGLRGSPGIRVIDPEFCFHGAAEVDAGVAVAHLALAGRPAAEAEAFLAAYGRPLDAELLGDLAGVEVVRRLIGVAQPPLPADAPRVGTLGHARAALAASAGWLGLFA